MSSRGSIFADFQTRLLTILIVVSIVPLALGGAAFLYLVDNNIARENFEKVAFVRDAKRSELSQYFSFARRQAESLGQTNIARYSVGDFYGFSYALGQIRDEEADAVAVLRSLFGVGDGQARSEPVSDDLLLGEALEYANAHSQFHREYMTFVESSEFDNVYLVNARGRVVYSVFKDAYLGRVLPQEHSTLARVAATLRNRPESPGIVFHDFVLDERTGAFAAYFVVRINLYQRSSATAILRLPASKLAALMDVDAEANGALSLISSGGKVIAASAEDTLSAGMPVTPVSAMDQDQGVALLDKGVLGVPSLTAWAHLPETGWLLSVDADAETAFASRDRLRSIILLLAALVLPLMLLLSYLVARSFTQPLHQVTDAAEAVAEGALDMPLPAFRRPTEFARLGRSVARMRDALSAQLRLISEKNAEMQKHIAVIAEKNVELEQADRMKDLFLANTSHELRTPLHGIIGISETLAAGAAGEIAAAQRNQLQLITFSARRLSRLVDDLLDLYRIRQGRMRLDIQAVDVAASVRNVLQLSETLISGEPVSLRVDIPDHVPPVLADPVRFEQILYNLIGNAIKYVDEGHIHVGARLQDGMIAVDVADTGPGISAEDLERIFQPLEQADNIDVMQRKNGAGLGLSIARNLAAFLGGTLTATSEPGQGTCFSLLLPAAEVTDAAERSPSGLHQTINSVRQLAAAPEPLDGAAATILVVDDEPINIQVLRNVLLPQGYNVLSADNGHAALELVRRTKPDLVVLDVMMNDLSGLDVARMLRRTHSLLDLPIIMVTARSRTRDMIAGFNAGANDYVVKPFVKDELLTRISTLLEAGRARRRAEENDTLREEVDRRIQVEDALRLSQRRMARLLDTLDAALLCANAKMTVTYANKAASHCFTQPVEPGKTPLASLLPTEIVELLNQQCQSEGESSADLALDGRDLILHAFELEPEAGGGIALMLADANRETEPLLVSVRGAIDSALHAIAPPGEAEGPMAQQGDEAYRAAIVDVMTQTLELWRDIGGKGKIDFAEESGIWRVSLDKSSLQTRTLDKYLLAETLPLNPRWRDVLRSAEFVLARAARSATDGETRRLRKSLGRSLSVLREQLRIAGHPARRESDERAST